jgi:hypothetical protein
MILALGWATAALLAQEVNASSTGAPSSLPKSGLQITSVSAYTAYYSSGLPSEFGQQLGGSNLPYDMSAGGSIQFDWTRFSERSTFSLSYAPSYTSDMRYSLSAFNHLVSLNIHRKLAPRWTFRFSAGAHLSTYAETLFSPTTLSNVAAVQANFNDLAAGLLASKFTNNPQLGVILTNSPLTESPVSNLLYGGRMLTASATTSLSYSFSPRLSLSFIGSGGRTQSISPNQALNASNPYAILDTTNSNGSVALSYSLSPFTQLGGSVTTSQVSSSLLGSYITTTSMLTLGRTLHQRWLMQILGGVGTTSILHSSLLAFPTGPSSVFGGSLGYKTLSHTFLGSYGRTVGDVASTIGLSPCLVAARCSSATAAWRWRLPGNSWWLEADFGWQQLVGNGVANTSGYRMTAGLNRALGTHAVLLTQYVYINYSGGLRSVPYYFSQNAMRVTVTWTHQPVALR